MTRRRDTFVAPNRGGRIEPSAEYLRIARAQAEARLVELHPELKVARAFKIAAPFALALWAIGVAIVGAMLYGLSRIAGM